MDVQLPDDPTVNYDSLGPFQAEFRTGSYRHKIGIGILVMGIIVSGSIDAFLLYFLVMPPAAGVQGPLRLIIAAAVAVIPTAMLVIALLYLIRQIRRLRWRALLFANGLVLDRGGPAEAILWDQIKYVYETVKFSREGIIHLLRIVPLSGRPIIMDEIFDIGTLAQRVQAACFPSLLAQANEQLQRKEPVEFGSLKLHLDGLEVAAGRMHWGELQRISIEREHNVHKLMFRKIGEKKYGPNARCPNSPTGNCSWS